MKKLSPRALSALAFLVYFASYATRINYGAIISEIVSAEGISKSYASLAVTFSFISYGAGQLVSGYIGDKASPNKIIMAGLVSSSLFNIFMTVSGANVALMCTLWTLNGFSQSLIWPPLVRILAGSMTRNDYNRACVTVSAAGSFGTIFLYIAAPLLIRIGGWRLVFLVSASIGIIAAILFRIFTGKSIVLQSSEESAAPVENEKADHGGIGLKTVIISSGLPFICIGILLQGILRDGITTWTPSFLSETFDIPATSSIFTSVLVPLFSILSFKLTSEVNRRIIKNELTLSAVLFALSSVCVCLSPIIKFMPVSVLLVSIAAGCMHGVNLLLVCQLPGRFAKYGKSSLISGSMNFFTYVGSALSTYGIAKIAESSGWTAVLMTCAGVAAAGLITCIAANRKWKDFSAANEL